MFGNKLNKLIKSNKITTYKTNKYYHDLIRGNEYSLNLISINYTSGNYFDILASNTINITITPFDCNLIIDMYKQLQTTNIETISNQIILPMGIFNIQIQKIGIEQKIILSSDKIIYIFEIKNIII